MTNYSILATLYIFSILILGLGGSLGSMVSNKTSNTIEENKNVRTIGLSCTIVGSIFIFGFICLGISFFVPYTSGAVDKIVKSFSYMLIAILLCTIFILAIGISIIVISDTAGDKFLDKDNKPFTNQNDIEEARNDYYVQYSQWIIAVGVFMLTSTVFYTINIAGKTNPKTFDLSQVRNVPQLERQTGSRNLLSKTA